MAAAAEKKHTFAVCAYGESPYLKACVESLLPMREEGSGLILCTSSDCEFLRGIAAEYGIPYYVNPEGGGLGRDWNFALKTAAEETGAELVTIAHQDDVYRKDYLRELRKSVLRWGDASVFSTRCRNIDENGRRYIGRSERVKRILRLPLRLRCLNGTVFGKRLTLRFGNSIVCPSCTYDLSLTGRDLFRENFRFVADWDALLRISGMPGRFVCTEKELLSYRIHQGSATKANIENHNREKEEMFMFSRMWPRPVAVLLMMLYRTSYTAYDRK